MRWGNPSLIFLSYRKETSIQFSNQSVGGTHNEKKNEPERCSQLYT